MNDTASPKKGLMTSMSRSEERVRIFEEAVELLDRLNTRNPSKASDYTIKTVEECKRLLRQAKERREATAESTITDNGKNSELLDLARDILSNNSFDDSLSMLSHLCGTQLDLAGLIELVGKQAYIDALKREADVFLKNKISFKQIADLWNETGRPSLGDERWTARGVSLIDRYSG